MEIGGYFPLEIDDKGSIYHNKVICTNHKRNGLIDIQTQNNYFGINVLCFALNNLLFCFFLN